jgi:hypothetical protein
LIDTIEQPELDDNMNIVLADVQPSSINLSEPVAESYVGDGKFSNLMDQQLNQTENPSVIVEKTQVVDIKELNINP